MHSWHIYALGGGWGHFTRALSLARAAAKRGIEVEILANSPWAHLVVNSVNSAAAETSLRVLLDLPRSIQFRLLPCDASFEATAKAAADWVRSVDAGVLFVDTFPRGLGGELADVLPRSKARRVWIHRDLDPRYVAEFQLESFAQHFELILVPGEDAPLAHLPQARRTLPWLIADSAELLSPAAARAELGVPGSQPIIAVSGSGTDDEVRETGEWAARLESELAEEARVIWICAAGASRAPGPPTLSVWPLLLLLPGVDVLVGSGGYHTVHEARATGTPLVALPRPRRYDRQGLRLRASERIESAGELVARIRAFLVAKKREPKSPYENGAREAVEIILRSEKRPG